MKNLTTALVMFLAITVGFPQTVINEYAKVTSIPSCSPCAGNCDELIVHDATGFNPGDVIMIIQVKGAQVELGATAAFGDVLDYGAAGFHEKNTINNIIGNTIYLGSNFVGAYDATSSLQIVSVPQYPAGYIVPAGGITCPAWDGNTGGVIAFDVTGTLTLNGDIDARGTGLRGAFNPNTNSSEVFCAMKDKGDYFFDLADIQVAGRKGEGIAEWILPAYELGRGKWASGGGGGHNHNAGGGGGSNMGAGGLGGDEYGNLGCGSVVGIRNGIGGQALDNQGGLRLFMGGGGGAGQENNNRGNSGGDGGGVIFITADDIEGNGNWIRADGDKGINYAGIQDGNGGNDGGGGGGAGGSIKIQVTGGFGVTPLIITAEGSDGGSLDTQIHGPGGGGGGGLICTNVAAFPGNVTADVSGGLGGITTNDGSNWGTLPGDDGLISQSCNPPAQPPLGLSVNLGSDLNLCSPPTSVLDTRLDASNIFSWYVDGVLIPGATDPNYTANGPGTYRVVVDGQGACPDADDEIVVTSDAATPTNADFCGVNEQVNLSIAGPGTYDWYDQAVGGAIQGSGPNFQTPPISATTTYYVEDNTVFNYTAGPPQSGHGFSGGNGAAVDPSGDPQRYVEFDALTDFTLDAMTFAFKAWWIGAADRFNVTVTILDENDNVITGGTMANNNIDPGLPHGSVPGPNIRYVRVPIGISIPAGNNYKIQVSGSSPIHWFQNGKNTPYFDPGSEVIRIWGTHPDYMPFFDWQGNLVPANYAPNSFPGFFDWEVSAGIACDRVPVNANLACVTACEPPTAVGLSQTSVTACEGANLSITSIPTLGTSQNGGYSYLWYQGVPSGVGNGANTPLSLNPLQSGDAGTYTLRIEDGTAGDAACYLEESVTVNVEVAPTITISPGESECSGDAFNYTITADVAGSSFSWARAAVAGITPATGNGATSSIAETLTSTNTTATAVTYALDATGPAPGNCPAAQQDLILTINPVPTITNGFDETVCGGTATAAIALTADVAGTTYNWSAVSSSGDLGGGFDVGPTAGNIPSESITNSGSTSETVTYTIIPTAGTCTGNSATHVVTVDPAPVVNETGQYDSICSGVMHSGLALSSTPSGATFNYVAVASDVTVTGFTAVGNGVNAIPAEALTNSGTTVETVTYTITPVANTCPGATEDFVVYVNPVADVTNAPVPQALCAGNATAGVSPLTSNVAGAEFSWVATNAGGNISGYASSGTASIPAEVWVHNGTVTETVTYDVTPSINGCIGTPELIIYTVTLDPPPVIDNVVIAESICSGASSAGVVLSATPSAGVTYTWSTVNSSADVSVPTTGGIGDLPAEVGTNTGGAPATVTYTVVPSTAICTGPSWDYTLTVNPLPTPDIQPLTTRCEGDVFTVSNANHSGGSTYVWSTTGTGVSDNGSTTQDLEITAGSANISVTVTETDGNNCTSNPVNETINVDEFPTIPVAMADFDACIADAITLPGTQATVGTGVWTFASTNAATIDDVNLFNSGVSGLVGNEVITATWTVSNGVCPDQAETIAITGKGIADPTVSLSVDDDLVCAGDVVNFTASGNNGGSTPLYTFFDGQNGTVQAQGASTTLALTATQDTSIYVELESNSSCLSDPLLNTAISATIDITVDAVPSTSAAGTDIVVCQNTTTMAATAVTSGQGTWEKVSGPGTVVPGDENNPTASVNGLDQTTPTLYNWVVRSANDACPSSTDDVQIEQAGDLSPSDVTGQSTTICETAAVPVLTGSAFDAAANPAESGTWSAVAPATIAQAGLNGTIANLQTGVNKFVWEIANGLCVPSNTDTVYITVDAAPDAAVYNGLNPLETCGATEQLDAQALTVGTGTWTYVSGPGNIIAGEENLANARVENLVTGTTSEFIWSTENGVCTGNSVNVEVIKLDDISPAEIGVSGDLTLALGAATSADLCETGSYNILSSPYAADELGTWSTISGTSVTIAADNSNSQAMTINSAGTTQVEWSIAKTLGGTCPALTVTMDLIVHAAPTATVTASSVDTCENTAITFTGGVIGATDQGTWTASGATSTVAPGSENNPILTYSALPVGTTTLTFEVDNAGCAPTSASESVTIEAVADPTITIDYTGSTTLCAPANLTLPTTTTGGGAAPQYTWTVNGPVDATNTTSTYSESNIAAGFYTYEVTLNSSSRCVTSNNVTDDITISFVDGPTPQILENDTTSCANAPVVLNATGVQGILQWFDGANAMSGETGTSITVTSAGTYSYTDNIGTCPPVPSNNVQVNFETIPVAVAMEDTNICLNHGATIPLTGVVNTANWHWTNEAGDAFGQNADPAFANETVGGVYVFTLRSEGAACPDATDETIVYLQTDVKPVNVFTPNGDGVNDVWNIQGIETYTDATVRIFNRWGAPIFETYRGYADEPWDGSINGNKEDNVGTYYYIIETASDACGGAQKGFVELMR